MSNHQDGGIQPQDVVIERGDDAPNPPPQGEPPKKPGGWKIKIGTRDIALALAFILIVAGLIAGKIEWEWAIAGLLVVATGEGVSQYFHGRSSG